MRGEVKLSLSNATEFALAASFRGVPRYASSLSVGRLLQIKKLHSSSSCSSMALIQTPIVDLRRAHI